jgi:hypothetical protein
MLLALIVLAPIGPGATALTYLSAKDQAAPVPAE